MMCTPEAEDQDDLYRYELTERIREKVSDYERYGFSLVQANAFNVFFDLSQEYEDIKYLYYLPVSVLRLYFNMPAALYVRGEGEDFTLRTSPLAAAPELPPLADLHGGVVQIQEFYYFPVRGRFKQAGDVPHPLQSDDSFLIPCDDRKVLAVLVLKSDGGLLGNERLYYEKFANRLGFSLHNRILAQKNKEHIRFVRGLVHDIGHNVIVPNMYFKLLIRQMEGKIKAFGGMCTELLKDSTPATICSLALLHERMVEQYQEIVRHFQQSSFFLETLLRQSHFDQGQYVLQTVTLNIAERVVRVQAERYRARLTEKGIQLKECYPSEGAAPIVVQGDVGLLSQVMANFLSNAIKYTRPDPDSSELHVRCVVVRIPDHYGPGRDAARVGIYSTGLPIPEQDRPGLFTESYRASNTEDEYGTGHGLYFIRLIMEQHGGEAGYRWEDGCNFFYFMMPCAAVELQS